MSAMDPADAQARFAPFEVFGGRELKPGASLIARLRGRRFDPLLDNVDTNLDDSVRKTDAAKADDIMAENQVTLPLDPLPDILIWSKKLVGPIGDNTVEGPFWNINEWGCTNGVCA